MTRLKIKRIKAPIDKICTMADLGVGVARPLNKEKRAWIKKLVNNPDMMKPIILTPIKDSGYYLMTDGWHRLQAAKKKRQKTINALTLPADAGIALAKANKVLRDIDREYNFQLEVSDIIGHWAMMKGLFND
jgi:uncharacterized ParB-like nuclease family protein